MVRQLSEWWAGKHVKGSGHGQTRGSLPEFAWGKSAKTWKLKTADVPVGTRTTHFLNTRPQKSQCTLSRTLTNRRKTICYTLLGYVIKTQSLNQQVTGAVDTSKRTLQESKSTSKLNIQILWEIHSYRRFNGQHRFHLQGQQSQTLASAALLSEPHISRNMQSYFIRFTVYFYGVQICWHVIQVGVGP